jgi:kynureninase
MTWTERAAGIDRQFAAVNRRSMFDLASDVVYLDGNSLGPLPQPAQTAITIAVRDEWGKGLIRSWNSADWIGLPLRTGDRIANLIGAQPGTVIAADSTSINLYKVLHAALDLQNGRTEIVTDIDNFPTDLYIVDEVARQRGLTVRDVKRSQIWESLTPNTAVLTLTHVDYRTSEMADLQALTNAAHAVGALVIWDFAHSAGAVPLDVTAAEIDFAVGCGYKFLNGGPGAPAFLYVAPRHLGASTQPIEGWIGHANAFAFTREYEPADGIAQFQVGTPSVLGMRALYGALEVFDGVDMRQLHAKSVAMAGLFHEYADEVLVPRGFGISSHRDAQTRGSHVALSHDDGYAIVQALIARNIIGDFRRPNVMRFGIAPLYNSAQDMVTLVDRIVEIYETEEYKQYGSEAAVI